jgi:probable phosphoglycerate mutase
MARERRSQPTLVLFLRHGETPTTGRHLPGRAPGLHLSDAGHEQAKRAAEAIAEAARVTAVYTSPMERTRETAEPVGDALGLEPRPLADLIEIDYGDWTGIELRAAAKLPEWRAIQRFPSGFRFPGGESFLDVQTRMARAVERLVADHPGETVVAVSHADPIRVAVAGALGVHLDLFQRVMVSPCSITAVAYGPDGAAVLCVNASATGLNLPRPKPEPATRKRR